jgi:hypothetical protein
MFGVKFKKLINLTSNKGWCTHRINQNILLPAQFQNKAGYKSRDLILLGKDYECLVSNKQENQSGSDTKTKILISKETYLKTKLNPSNIKFYNKMKQLKSGFNPKPSKVMESFVSGSE